MTALLEAPTAAPVPTRDHRWLALAVLAASQLMIVLDATITNVAIPTIGAALRFSPANLQWVVNAYTLTFGGFLLLGGRFADRLGRRRMFMVGIALFALASLLGGLAGTSTLLVAARALQGLGAAAAAPAALSTLTVTFEEGTERNRALGIWAAIAGSGAAIGLLLGGVLTQYASWRWVFFVNVPVAAIALALTPALVPESRDDDAPRFDAAGAVLVTGGLVAIVYGLVRGNAAGWSSASTLGALIGGLALLVAFVAVEATTSAPLVRLSIFRSRTLTGANAVNLLVGAGLFAMFFFVTLYLQDVQHYSAIRTGFASLPAALLIVVSAGAASQLLSRIGPRPLIVVGTLIAAAGLALLVRIHPGAGYWTTVGLPFLLLGLALLSAIATARTAHVSVHRAPALLGHLSGHAVYGPQPGALTSGWAWAIGAGSALLLLGAVLGGWLITLTREQAAGVDLLSI